MAAMVEGRSTKPQVIELANAIGAAQGPEMEQMSTLLTGPGKPAPTTKAAAGMSGTDHAAGGMSGTMSAQQMSELAARTAPSSTPCG